MMRSFFVYVRVIDDVEHFAVGCGVLPVGVRQIGCFATLDEARGLRDRKRREALRVTLPLTTRLWSPNARESAS
jgi:hypothetical protein